MKSPNSIRKVPCATLIIGTVSVAAFMLFLIRSDTAIDYMKKGLKLCSATVIPSLFPFMVISELIVSSDVGRLLGKLFSKPAELLFGVSENCACALALGTVCGFPIGAKTLCLMYDRGEISKKELERAMTFCNNPGSAFVISAVGISLFEDRRVGMILYLSVIASSVIIGIFARIIFGKITPSSRASTKFENGSDDSIRIFVNAIKSSAFAMLTVCALVTFFSSFVGCLGSILSGIGNSAIAVIFSFFELSSGVGMSAELENINQAIITCAAALGWSGLSVHLQIASICAGRDISLKPYLVAKLFQSVLCAILTGVALKIFPISKGGYRDAFFHINGSICSNATFLCAIFFLAAILPLILNRKTVDKQKKAPR